MYRVGVCVRVCVCVCVCVCVSSILGDLEVPTTGTEERAALRLRLLNIMIKLYHNNFNNILAALRLRLLQKYD